MTMINVSLFKRDLNDDNDQCFCFYIFFIYYFLQKAMRVFDCRLL